MYFYRLITYTRRQRQIDELDRRTNEQLRWDLAAAERQFEAEYEDAVSSYRSSVAQTADRFYSEAQETGSLPPAASWLEDLLGTAIQAAPRSRSLEWISPQMTFTVHPAKITACLRPSPGITPDWDEETDREWAEKEYEYNFKNQQERSPITATDPDGRAVQCAAYASLLARVLRESVLEKYPLGPYDEEPGSSEVRVQTVVGGNSAALEYMAANREFVPIS